MDWETFKTKSVRRNKNVEEIGLVRDLRVDDMGFPYFRRDHNRLSWTDRPLFRLLLLAMIFAVWIPLIFIIGFN